MAVFLLDENAYAPLTILAIAYQMGSFLDNGLSQICVA